MEKPLVFTHIVDEEERGKELSDDKFSSFVASVALAIIDSDGAVAFRLVNSNTPCISSYDKLYIIPFAMFPEEASLDESDRIEGERLAMNLKKILCILPLSFACLSGDFSKKIAGCNYVVKFDSSKLK